MAWLQAGPKGADLGDRHVAGYSFGPATVDVDTDTADANDWLKTFLAPAVDVTAFGDSGVLVRLTCSDEAFEAVGRPSPSATRPIPFFALDSHLVTFPGWDDGEATVLAAQDFGGFYRIHGRRVDIVGPPGTRLTRLALMRVVREILVTSRLARGGLLDLHAAAFEVDQRAVLIAGPKYSGKTTLLCYALTSGRARVLANDRVLVDVDQDRGDVHGIPTLVSIRPDTLRTFPDLQAGSLHELSPSRLAERLGASSVRSAPLAAVVFPEIVAGTDAWTFAPLSTADGLARLDTCVYGARRDRATPTILEQLSGRIVSRVHPGVMSGDLAGKVRFLRCTLGASAYERSADDWLRALGLDAAFPPYP